MDLHVKDENGICIIEASGRMDAVTVKDFEEVSTAVTNERHARILVDFSQLEFISSAGLRGILKLAKNCKAGGLALSFCALTPMVSEVFSIAGLGAILRIYPTKEDAFASF